MKKILVSLAILSCIVLMNSLVLAASQNQGVKATIAGTINLIVAPANLEFKDIIQGSSNNAPTNGPIEFSAGEGANVDMSIEFTSVTTNGLFEKMEIQTDSLWVLIITKPVIDMPCTIVDDKCTYTDKSANAKLSVPAGFPAGIKTGIITYTVTGSFCGDGIKNGEEVCDSTDLGSETCITQEFTGGTLACKSDCTFDTSRCTTCAPDCTGKTCGGNDGCGGSCEITCAGTCTDGVCGA